MNAKACLPLICCAIRSCVGSVEIRELQMSNSQEISQEVYLIAYQTSADLIQALYFSCGDCREICSEDHFQILLQNLFPSMPGNESDYFCHDESRHYYFCQTDLTRYRTPKWNTSVWHYLFTFLAHSAGHTWWSPCAFNSLDDPDMDGNGCLSKSELGGMLNNVIWRVWVWTNGYHKQIDTDSDGCASVAEITAYLARRSPGCAFNLFHELACLNSTEGCRCSSGASKHDLSEHLVWSAWTHIESALLFQQRLRNESANITAGQLDQEGGEDESKSPLLIALISGIIAIVALVAFTVTCWYQKYQRDSLRQPQKLLRAKIDAWSTFDDNLIAKTSSLHASFVHCLGLGGFQSHQLSLLKLTHPEDMEAVSSLLHQLKSNKNLSSLPLMAQVRFKYGVTEAVGHDGDITQSEDCVNVEILMAWSSSISIIVGLTSLSAACPPNASYDSMRDFSEVVVQANVQQQNNYDDLKSSCQVSTESTSREYVLNAPSQVTGSASDVESFKSMEAEFHRGGHITKELNDFKSDMFKQSVSQLFPEEVPEAQSCIDAKSRDRAADSGADRPVLHGKPSEPAAGSRAHQIAL